jgi:4-hydroxybutyrate dehydrogenase
VVHGDALRAGHALEDRTHGRREFGKLRKKCHLEGSAALVGWLTVKFSIVSDRQAAMSLIYYVTQIQFEFGAIRLLKQECQRVGIKRPLVVTDAGVRAAGVLQKALDALEGLPYAVFDGTPSNPTEAAVRAASAIYRAQGCDGLVAVGGGSAIDCAKGVAILATHEGPLTHYATIEGGSARISERVAPLIAVPTTSGTGSEVARGAIIIVDDHRKLGFHSWHLVPKTAICDPELTMGLPPKLTAATGMDAIAHCMETFMAAAFNPPADGIALDGLERGWSHIERATRDGSDREARLNLMSASMQGAMAFQKGLGCVHSLSHSLGGVDPRLHHGTLNALFLPAVVRFNAQAPSVQKDRRLDRMAQAMGVRSGSDIPEAIRELNARLGLPSGLAAVGVERGQFDKIIDGAMADHCHKTNPREASREDYVRMLEESL